MDPYWQLRAELPFGVKSHVIEVERSTEKFEMVIHVQTANGLVILTEHEVAFPSKTLISKILLLAG